VPNPRRGHLHQRITPPATHRLARQPIYRGELLPAIRTLELDAHGSVPMALHRRDCAIVTFPLPPLARPAARMLQIILHGPSLNRLARAILRRSPVRIEQERLRPRSRFWRPGGRSSNHLAGPSPHRVDPGPHRRSPIRSPSDEEPPAALASPTPEARAHPA